MAQLITYTLKLVSGYNYNLYLNGTQVSDSDLATLFATAGSAYFVFDFDSGTPSNLTRLTIVDSNSTTVVSKTNLGTGFVVENLKYKGVWSNSATTFDSFTKLLGRTLDESQLSFLMGKIKERPIVGSTLSTPSNVAYVATANIQDGAVTPAKIATATYSTTEQVIGTWVDGKPLYRKTLNCGVGPNNGTVQTALNVTGAKIHNLYGTGINSAGSALPVNSARPVDGISSSIGAYYNGAQIVIESGADRSGYTFYITVEYTKASD